MPDLYDDIIMDVSSFAPMPHLDIFETCKDTEYFNYVLRFFFKAQKLNRVSSWMYDYKRIPGLSVRLETQETRISREGCGKHIYIVAMKTTWIASSYFLGLYFTFLYIFEGKECYET